MATFFSIGLGIGRIKGKDEELKQAICIIGKSQVRIKTESMIKSTSLQMRNIKSLYIAFGRWATVNDLSYARSMALFCDGANGEAVVAVDVEPTGAVAVEEEAVHVQEFSSKVYTLNWVSLS